MGVVRINGMVIREIPKIGRTLPGSIHIAQPTGGAIPGSTGGSRGRSSAPRRAASRKRAAAVPRAPKATKKKAATRSVVAKARVPSSAKKSSTSKAGAAERITTAVAKQIASSAVQRALPRLSAKTRAKQTRAVFGEIKKTVGAAVTRAATAAKSLSPRAQMIAKGTGVAAAGAAAYAITRKSKLGGKVGDYVVAKVHARKDAKADARLRAFRSAVAAERARGPVSSARVKQLAAQYGPF